MDDETARNLLPGQKIAFHDSTAIFTLENKEYKHTCDTAHGIYFRLKEIPGDYHSILFRDPQPKTDKPSVQ